MKEILVLLLLLLAACDSGTLWEDEQYAVYWIDSSENISLGIKIDDSTFIGRHGPPPFSVGSNNEYLVVKEGQAYYYIIKKEDSWKNDHAEGRHGPFTENVFLKYKQELQLPEFEVHFN